MSTFSEEIKQKSAADSLILQAEKAKAEQFEKLRLGAEDLSKLLENRYKLSKKIQEQEALNEFSIDVATIENVAFMHPETAHEFVDQKIAELKDHIKSKYTDLGEEFDFQAGKIRANAIINTLRHENRGSERLTQKLAKDSAINLGLASNTFDPNQFDELLGKLKMQTQEVFGDGVAELFAQNGKSIGDARRSVARTGFFEGDGSKMPIIAVQDSENLSLNTGLGTKIVSLASKNPMLARGFLRIQAMTDQQASAYAEQIRSAYPDSPEPAAIQTAVNLRRMAVRENALEYGANQLMYSLPEEHNNLFTGEIDERFKASSFALQKFGTTNFFTQNEREILKTKSSEEKLYIFSILKHKLQTWNIYAPKNQKIDPIFASKEMKDIDADTYNIMILKEAVPEFKDILPSMIKGTLENLKTSGEIGGLSDSRPEIQDELLSVSGMSSFLETAYVASRLRTGKKDSDASKSSTYFESIHNYAYLRKYSYGNDFENEARILLNNKDLKLKNIDIDMYGVFNKNGTPFLVDGKPMVYSAEFLQDTIQRRQ